MRAGGPGWQRGPGGVPQVERDHAVSHGGTARHDQVEFGLRAHHGAPDAEPVSRPTGWARWGWAGWASSHCQMTAGSAASPVAPQWQVPRSRSVPGIQFDPVDRGHGTGAGLARGFLGQPGQHAPGGQPAGVDVDAELLHARWLGGDHLFQRVQRRHVLQDHGPVAVVQEGRDLRVAGREVAGHGPEVIRARLGGRGDGVDDLNMEALGVGAVRPGQDADRGHPAVQQV